MIILVHFLNEQTAVGNLPELFKAAEGLGLKPSPPASRGDHAYVTQAVGEIHCYPISYLLLYIKRSH